MMRSNLPNKILGVVFAAVLILCGCSGFTSDPPIAGTTDDSGVNLQKEFAVARTYAQGSYEVKESSENTKTGVISISLVQESGCVKQGETYQWVDDLNRVTQFAGGLFRYSFAGDTLTLTALNEEPDYYGNVTVLKFVGGELGKLQGIWLQLSRSAYTVYWNFGEGSIEIRVLEKENFNYMQSLFMWMFFEGLEDSSMDIYADLIYDEHAVDPGRYGEAILKQDNRSETFTYKGVTYELKIDSVHSFDDYLSMTFSSGSAKCHLEYFSTLNVTSEMCKAENADGLHYSDATPDVMTRYSRGNEDEFGKCVKQLMDQNKEKKTAWNYLNPNVDYDEMTDERDGQVYKTVKIGNQIWMAENLNYASRASSTLLDSSSFCYNNVADSCVMYGRLYLWNAALEACPEGWHLPDNDEWKILLASVASSVEDHENFWYYIGAGVKLKTTAVWESSNGVDGVGFSVLPAGAFFEGNEIEEIVFDNAGGLDYGSSYFWSSSPSGDNAYLARLSNKRDDVDLESVEIDGLGSSVRCVKNF